ncbi:MAG: hypothetical protein WD249_13400 [Gaiellaceae bacterium]
MAALRPMPPVTIDAAALQPFGQRWHANSGRLTRSQPHSSLDLSNLFARSVAEPLAVMLGDISIVAANRNSLMPSEHDCVEVGDVRIVGGVRPQNFDVGYRPDGIRFALDSKTLNDRDSVAKNYQNMINDLATEATTVHTRFPYALVGFIVGVPAPCLVQPQSAALIGTLERLGRRSLVDEPAHLAEAIALVVWDPASGALLDDVPDLDSPLRLESFSPRVEQLYVERYKGLPPHAAIGEEAEEAEEEAAEEGA